ncbi:MAG TPA: hypothetical protein G4N94_05050, partial [Caldilineae bacterium]|nr:hypothetical protein [Caldilineae bacterium]
MANSLLGVFRMHFSDTARDRIRLSLLLGLLLLTIVTLAACNGGLEKTPASNTAVELAKPPKLPTHPPATATPPPDSASAQPPTATPTPAPATPAAETGAYASSPGRLPGAYVKTVSAPLMEKPGGKTLARIPAG